MSRSAGPLRLSVLSDDCEVWRRSPYADISTFSLSVQSSSIHSLYGILAVSDIVILNQCLVMFDINVSDAPELFENVF